MESLYIDCRQGIRDEEFIQALLELGGNAGCVGKLLDDSFEKTFDTEKATEIVTNSHMTGKGKELAKKSIEILGSVRKHMGMEQKVQRDELETAASVSELICSLKPSEVFRSGIPVGLLEDSAPGELCEIAERYRFQVFFTSQKAAVSPVALAVLAAVTEETRDSETFLIKRIGYGNRKERGVRIFQIRSETGQEEPVYKLESNIDDCSGEALGYVMERLLAAGARDVNYIPVYMKKNRPAYQLNVLCDADKVSQMESIIFAETTTIGIRKMKVERTVLKREIKKADTPYGQVRVKVCQLAEGEKCYPEYEDVAALSRKLNRPFIQVYQDILKEL